MTNAKKFLKDGVSVEELIEQMEDKMINKYGRPFYKEDTKQFFEDEYQKIPPKLLEDERVILRNIMFFTKIGKNKECLYVSTKENSIYRLGVFNHLFQFIKERRRIFY